MPQSGESNHQAKLTEAEVLEIFEMAHSGKFYQYEIAAAFSVSRTCVEAIKLRRNWGHLSKPKGNDNG
jgi:hypothetical protein